MRTVIHKFAVFIFLVIILMGCATKLKTTATELTPEKAIIKINLTQTSSYCGGAYPPDEVMADLQSPKKLPNQKIYIRPGIVNDWNVPLTAEGVSDINGVVVLELLDGTYSLIYENKVNTTYYKQLLQQFGQKSMEEGGIDKKCLEEFIHTPEATFEVKNGKTSAPIIVNLHHGCPWERTPCLPSDGNLPPTAPDAVRTD
jgi:hypothetical protein